MNKKIWLSSPHMSKEGYEMEYIKDAFSTNWIAPLGPNVNEFEKEFLFKVGAVSAISLSSGTAAIHMALKASGVGEGDIVLCQSLTFSASANPIIYENAIPVFIDSDFETWNMSPDLLEEALIKYPNAKAVIVVHLYGLSADMDIIIELCKKYGVILIEDAAESLGTTYKGRYTGTFGDFGIYSFNGNKIITTSGGGMLVSDDETKMSKVKFWATQSRDPARHYQHSELGYNYRLSNVLAGIGRGQLKVLDERVEQKRGIFNYYINKLGYLKGLEFMPMNNWNNPNCWLTCITLKDKEILERLFIEFENANIECRPIWKPMHLQPFFKDYDFVGSNVSQYLFEHGLCLPSDTNINTSELSKIVNIIIKEFKDE